MNTAKYVSLIGFCLILFPYSIYCATLQVPSSQYPTVQSAIDAANSGDTIVLQAGMTFTESVVLKYKSGSDYITIQSSELSNLPASGNRIDPSYSQYMPKITSQHSGESAIRTEITQNGPSHHYKLVGIEIGEFQSTREMFDIIQLGEHSPDQNTLEKVAHHFIIDRCFIHGHPDADSKNGIALNSADTQIISSYITDIHHSSAESHGIVGINGTGRYQIVNNFIAASSINVFFGGADPYIQGLSPTDIVIKKNYVKKLDNWLYPYPETTSSNTRWIIKNNFELKNAREVTVEDNIFDTNCGGVSRQGVACRTDQRGASILFTVRNQEGTAPWSTIEDVTFRYNIVRNVPGGMLLLGTDDTEQSQNLENLSIENNLFLPDGVQFGGVGDCININGGTTTGIGTDNLVLNHNTCINFSGSSQLFIRGETIAIVNGLQIDNNLSTQLGNEFYSHIFRDDDDGKTPDNGIGGLNNLAGNSWTMSKNLLTFNQLYNYWITQYPSNNFYVQNISNIGFENVHNGQFQLSQTSPYKNQGTDGQDLGADIIGLNARTACT